MTTTLSTAETFAFMGEVVAVRLPAERTAGAVSMLEHLAPQGMATPLHVQPNEDEVFYVLDGRITVHLDGEVSEAGAGDVVLLPRGVPHAFRVDSERARILALSVPGHHERFFRLAGDPADTFEPAAAATADPPDFARMTAAAAESGFEILGPPPFEG
ncbi:cupin domain-containing protein [Solirubrobacter sp. CPCC 204708]|uniref:Cupin domain-containing protein n=1 Tax=Solirubrobacter deserti TaxID=2282478 RepID=A0ABT4RQL3_9ACTN|nr:cupin domain-containing protein [Solirubrobacter deserti]MBE2319364.1 cupin domain-containing protein [Solirubrobacter deserti]MDA0140862.1 cupin domain-containing protein [Solirubrobacter deserti]